MKRGEDHRDQHQGDQGGAGQAPHHRACQWGLGVGTLADAQGQRQQAQDGREGGYQDRAQAARGGRLRSGLLLDAHPLPDLPSGLGQQEDHVVHHDAPQVVRRANPKLPWRGWRPDRVRNLFRNRHTVGSEFSGGKTAISPTLFFHAVKPARTKASMAPSV